MRHYLRTLALAFGLALLTSSCVISEPGTKEEPTFTDARPTQSEINHMVEVAAGKAVKKKANDLSFDPDDAKFALLSEIMYDDQLQEAKAKVRLKWTARHTNRVFYRFACEVTGDLVVDFRYRTKGIVDAKFFPSEANEEVKENYGKDWLKDLSYSVLKK